MRRRVPTRRCRRRGHGVHVRDGRLRVHRPQRHAGERLGVGEDHDAAGGGHAEARTGSRSRPAISSSAADIAAGKLKFFPAANANGAGYASFNFQVRDDGGTANGGVDLDRQANTITVDVTSVNDAPAGADKTVSTNEDTAYTFAAADFGFTDPNDTPRERAWRRSRSRRCRRRAR